MKPLIVLFLFFLVDKLYFVKLSQVSLDSTTKLPSNESLPRFLKNIFTRKVWVKRRRTSPIIINANNKKNSTRSSVQMRCGTPSILPKTINSGRIINGEVANPNSWPWLVSIRQSKNSNLYHVCAGSLISAQHVLTAAHCVFDYENTTFAIVIGINNLNEKIRLDNTFLITRYLIHPEFERKSLRNDIAILYLNLPVRFSRKIMPICLPSTNNMGVVYEKKVVVIGWGSTNGYNSQKTLSNQLLQTTLQIRNFNSESLCRGYDNLNYCALDSNKNDSKQSNICFGDSGGSLMYQVNGAWYLYGISSFIFGDSETQKCISSIPSFYTIVPKYLNWILNYVSKN